MAILRVASTAETSPGILSDIRTLLMAAFDNELSDEDWEHTIGGVHFMVEDDGVVVAHASVVPRVIEVGTRPLRTGYVEGVGTDPKRRREGFASLAMTAVSEHICAQYEMGALGTDLFAFYERFGWERWSGPTYVRRADGLSRSEDEDGYVMVLRCGASEDIDISSSISCDERSGDDW